MDSTHRLRRWRDAIVKDPGVIRWYLHWRLSPAERHSPLGDKLPRLNYGAISWVARRLKRDTRVFEWGSGGSTVFFARRVDRMVSIEHDPVWLTRVQNALSAESLSGVRLELAEPVPANPVDPWFASKKARYDGFSFETYIRKIDEYPDGHFDLVLVDGRARVGCMKRALSKIRPGGYLVLDDSDRQEYDPGRDLVAAWKTIPIIGPNPYSRGDTHTTVWQRAD